jgi:hypothetical protein
MQKNHSLSDLDRAGWLLAPGETKDSLLQRKKILDDVQINESLLDLEDPDRKGAEELTEALFCFRLQNIPVMCSKKDLFPWQGAVLWTYFTEEGEGFPVLQVRKTFLCSQKELIAHEMVHAARFAFKEPWFEEVLAYRTSKNFLRKFFGPLCFFSIESTVLMLSSWIGFAGWLIWEKGFFIVAPILIFCLLLLRLFAIQFLFYRAEKKLKKRGDPSPLATLLRLSDREIVRCAWRGRKREN